MEICPRLKMFFHFPFIQVEHESMQVREKKNDILMIFGLRYFVVFV